jgi:hypothetical protein
VSSKGSNNVWCLVVSNPPPTLGAGTTCHLCHHKRYTRHLLQDDKLQSTSSARVGVALLEHITSGSSTTTHQTTLDALYNKPSFKYTEPPLLLQHKAQLCSRRHLATPTPQHSALFSFFLFVNHWGGLSHPHLHPGHRVCSCGCTVV